MKQDRPARDTSVKRRLIKHELSKCVTCQELAVGQPASWLMAGPRVMRRHVRDDRPGPHVRRDVDFGARPGLS
jgi:hypothetical protein